MRRHILIAIFTILSFMVVRQPAFGQEKLQLSMVTGAMGGTFFKVGAGIANILNAKLNEINITARGTGGALENLALLDTGKVDLGIIPSSWGYLARIGKPPFRNPLRNSRGVASLYTNCFQGYSLKSKNIITYADLKGRRVNVGQPGSAFEAIFKRILELHGLTYQDITVRRVTRQDAMDGIKDGNLDFTMEMGMVPLSTILEMTATHEVRLIEFQEGKQSIYLQKYPEFTGYIIPKGSYEGLGKDIETVADMVLLGCRKDLPEELVFKILDQLYAPGALKDVKESVHLGADALRKDKALLGMSIPLHPGAERYWKKEGLRK